MTAAPSPTYWPPHYSYSGLNTTYDPYLSPHYDYSQYYPTTTATTNITTQDALIDAPDAITSTTTEDITFAEAFTALANFEPNIVPEERPDTSTSTQIDVSAKQSGSYEHQHLQTFNEINSGKSRPAEQTETEEIFI